MTSTAFVVLSKLRVICIWIIFVYITNTTTENGTNINNVVLTIRWLISFIMNGVFIIILYHFYNCLKTPDIFIKYLSIFNGRATPYDILKLYSAVIGTTVIVTYTYQLI
jgi:hypothetical protein